MCGIVGYIGPRQAQEVILSGLKRLEYRGYDSAGLAILGQEGQFTLRRHEGKLSNLIQLVDERSVKGHTGGLARPSSIEVQEHPSQIATIDHFVGCFRNPLCRSTYWEGAKLRVWRSWKASADLSIFRFLSSVSGTMKPLAPSRDGEPSPR